MMTGSLARPSSTNSSSPVQRSLAPKFPLPVAQKADGVLKGGLKLLGFATDPPEAQDFVVKSRPEKEPDYIPIFQPPPEPATPVLKDTELKALRGDLDSVEKQADAVRSAFPPAAKAVADQKAQANKPKSAPAAANQ